MMHAVVGTLYLLAYLGCLIWAIFWGEGEDE